jgi:hypothetical protein
MATLAVSAGECDVALRWRDTCRPKAQPLERNHSVQAHHINVRHAGSGTALPHAWFESERQSRAKWLGRLCFLRASAFVYPSLGMCMHV